jgi:hypothetical protein
MAPCAHARRVTAIPLGRRLPGASSNLPERPIRTWIWRIAPPAAPIRFCSRWGLPCRFRCRKRGALLPHRFTLAAAIRYAPRRSVFCGTFPKVALAGRYPAPYVHGARTFLCGGLSAIAPAAVQPTDALGMRGKARGVKGRAAGRTAMPQTHCPTPFPAIESARGNRSTGRRIHPHRGTDNKGRET